MLGALVSQQVSAQAVPKDLWLFGTLRGAKKILNHEDTVFKVKPQSSEFPNVIDSSDQSPAL